MIAKEYDIGKGMFTDDCAFDAESLEVLKQSALYQERSSELCQRGCFTASLPLPDYSS